MNIPTNGNPNMVSLFPIELTICDNHNQLKFLFNILDSPISIFYESDSKIVISEKETLSSHLRKVYQISKKLS